MMGKVSEYDQRQLKLMKDQVSSYQQGRIALSDLIGDLIFLRDALEVCPQKWDLEFTEKITDLESINSFYLSENDGANPDHLSPVLNNAVKAISVLITDAARN